MHLCVLAYGHCIAANNNMTVLAYQYQCGGGGASKIMT